MADQTKVYEVVNSNPLFKTVLDYIQDQDSPAFNYRTSPDTFLSVKNYAGQTNREVVEATYTTKFERDHYVGKPVDQLKLKIGTRLAVEQQQINRAGLLTQGLEVVSNNVPLFKAQQLAALESNEGYNKPRFSRPIQGKVIKGSLIESYPDMTIWVWCRSLATKSNNYQGEIFNITPFIQHANTSVGKNGGNFTMSLPPLICENQGGTWVVKKQNIQFYQNKNKTSLQGTGYVADGSLYSLAQEKSNESSPHAEPPNTLLRNQFLFHNIISTNDVVFIRFETLQLEGQQRITDAAGLYVSKTNLPGRIYDMIGLVDINTQAISPQSTDVTINISGRDLSKLFIDDGTYFYFLEVSQGMLGGPGSGSGNGINQRLGADSALQFLSLYFNNTIENVFKFVINQLSNIKVTPDDLFSEYGDRRNTKFTHESDQAKFSKLDDQTATLKQGALKDVKSIRIKTGLTASSPSKEDSISTAVFTEMKRFLRDLRTQKVRRTNGNVTAGWNALKYQNTQGVTESIQQDVFPDYFQETLFNLQQTRVVPEADSIVSQIDQILDIEDSKSQHQDELHEELAPGIWQIVKLVIDKAVLGRRIIDSSLSSSNGPLLNFFRKVCQEPFVEYYMDTYGDMFYLTARKPPTDRASILSELQTQVVTEDQKGEKVNPAVIDIEPEDVLFEELSFSDNEAVSWYHLVPQASFFGSSDATSLAYLPAVVFPEYSDIWGARPLQIYHNYMPMTIKDPKKENGLDIAQKQAVEDMRYLIESNAYLPFTRRGTIKLNGDRRIKYGNLIRYKATGEVFRVEGVRHDFNINESTIDRTTSIEVSRGMVEQLIYGIPAVDDNGDTINGYISYFNLINTDPQFIYKDVTTYRTQQVKNGTKTTSFAKPDLLPNQPFSLSGTLLTIESSKILQVGNEGIEKLDLYTAQVKQRFTQLINGTNQLGYKVIITSTKRDYQQQYALWVANPKLAARPGHSKHETGLAMDMNIVNLKTGQQLTSTSTIKQWQDTGVIALAAQLGMIWGGNAFYDNYDPVHFQIQGVGGGSQQSETVDTYDTVTTPIKDKALDITKIFSNFKVNQYVFNFFLRREQFQKQYQVPTSGYYEQDSATGVTSKLLNQAVVTPGQNG